MDAWIPGAHGEGSLPWTHSPPGADRATGGRYVVHFGVPQMVGPPRKLLVYDV